jgi:hypothetical protein
MADHMLLMPEGMKVTRQTIEESGLLPIIEGYFRGGFEFLNGEEIGEDNLVVLDMDNGDDVPVKVIMPVGLESRGVWRRAADAGGFEWHLDWNAEEDEEAKELFGAENINITLPKSPEGAMWVQRRDTRINGDGRSATIDEDPCQVDAFGRPMYKSFGELIEIVVCMGCRGRLRQAVNGEMVESRRILKVMENGILE